MNKCILCGRISQCPQCDGWSKVKEHWFCDVCVDEFKLNEVDEEEILKILGVK